MKELVRGVAELSACCEGQVDDYSSVQYPPSITPYSRCRECGEMSRVMLLDTRTGEEVDYDTAYRSTE